MGSHSDKETLEITEGAKKKDNPEKPATMGTQDQEKQCKKRKTKQNQKHNMCWTPLYA